MNVATARSGNVVGGGDWGADRLVPDCLNSFSEGRAVQLRYPEAVRPWQHVLEALCGYLLLAERLNSEDGKAFATAWNFGPHESDAIAVKQVAGVMASHWGDGAVVETQDAQQPHETMNLTLDSTMARRELGWAPRWHVERALDATVSWFKKWKAGGDVREYSLQQLHEYCQDDKG